MKPERFFKHAAAAFLIALAIYAFLFTAIEHRRTGKGPWEVVFTRSPAGEPALRIDQPRLGITNVQIILPGGAPIPAAPVNVRFAQARPVPFDLPFGRCVFLDTTFLPGTVVLEFAGHQVQLLPRALTIDQRDRPWRSGEVIAVNPKLSFVPQARP